MTAGVVYDDGETVVTLWTRHGVTWERVTDPAETRYFHRHDGELIGVMRGYRGWRVHPGSARFDSFTDAIEHAARLVREVCGDGCRQTRRGSAPSNRKA